MTTPGQGDPAGQARAARPLPAEAPGIWLRLRHLTGQVVGHCLRAAPDRRLRAWLRRRLYRDWRAHLDQPRPGAEVGDGVLLHGWLLPPSAAAGDAVVLDICLRSEDGRELLRRTCRADQVWLPRPDVAAVHGDAGLARAGFAVGLDLRGIEPGALQLELRLHHPDRRRTWSCTRPLRRAAAPVGGDLDQVSLVGLLDRSMGLGAAARGTADILAGAGARVHRRPADGDGVASALRAGAATTVVQLNPDLLAGWLDGAGASAWTQRRIAAVAWELPAIPPGWREVLALWATEIWVPSRFVATALAVPGPGPQLPPVRRVAHAVQAPAPAQRLLARARGVDALADVAPGRPILLCVFDYASDIERKNPLAAIAVAARAAARLGALRPLLVLKSLGGSRFPADAARIAAAVARVRRHLEVRVIDQDLCGDDYWALLERCNVLLALHRAEGFGLVVAEAMALGKPVLVSDWSGTRDFADAGNAVPVPVTLTSLRRRRGIPAGPYLPQPAAYWGEPDLAHAVQLLTRVLTDPRSFDARAAQAATDIASLLAPAAIAADALADWCTPSQGAPAPTSAVPNTLTGAPASTRT
jgi:hypothetical protein